MILALLAAAMGLEAAPMQAQTAAGQRSRTETPEQIQAQKQDNSQSQSQTQTQTKTPDRAPELSQDQAQTHTKELSNDPAQVQTKSQTHNPDQARTPKQSQTQSQTQTRTPAQNKTIDQTPAQPENHPHKWTLQECIDYAVENNISLQQSRNARLSGLEDTYQAKAAMLPSLSASAGGTLTDRPFAESGSSTVIGSDVYSSSSSSSLTGNYNLSARMTLYSGGSLRTALKSSRLQNSIDSLSVQESTNDVVISIIRAYMQCLYAQEAVKLGESTAEASRLQRDRALELQKAGSLSKVDVAQLESQYASDRYQLTSARTSLDGYRLQLKQLLELGVDEEMELDEPLCGEDEVLKLLPPKSEVYASALASMPEIGKAALSVKASELAIKQARASYSPTLAASAGLGSANMSGTGTSLGKQLERNFNESLALSLSIPIFQGRQTKTAVNKAQIAADNSRLEQLGAEKTLLKEVEDVYLEALSAQSKYISAKEQESYAQQSYELTLEQFGVGMKNTVELITAQNSLLEARVSLLQSKYTALMNNALLDVYQGKMQ